MPDLQTKVAQALTTLAAEPASLVFTTLPAGTQATLTVPWVYQPATTGNLLTSSPVLECHALPVAALRLPAASMDALAERLAQLGRLHQLFRLEGDSLGYIVEAGDLALRIASMLRLAAELVPDDSQVALAAGLGPTDQVVEGRLSDRGRRSQVTLGSAFGRQALALAEPEDSVPAATLRSASEEIGRELAARVLRQFRTSRP